MLRNQPYRKQRVARAHTIRHNAYIYIYIYVYIYKENKYSEQPAGACTPVEIQNPARARAVLHAHIT